MTGVAVATGAYTAGSIGVDGLCVVRPDGKLYIHQGIGNLGTESFIDTARVTAEMVDMPWEKCVVVWGNTGEPRAVEFDPGGQPDHLCPHPRELRDGHGPAQAKLQEIAAKDLGGSPDDYDMADGKVFRKGNPGREHDLRQGGRARHPARRRVTTAAKCRRRSTR